MIKVLKTHSNIWACIITCFLYGVMYLLSLKNNMVFGGDSMQYLGMANKVFHFELPLSEKWMPLYSILIGVFAWVVGDIFVAATCVNFVLLLGIIVSLNMLINKVFNGRIAPILLLNALLLTNRELLYHAMSMMAELPMLFLFIVILVYLVFQTQEKKAITRKGLLVLSTLSVLAIFTKYNAIVIVLMISSFLLFWDKQKRKGLSLLVYLSPIALIYSLWIWAKPGKEVIVTALFKPELFSEFTANAHYFFTVCIDYFTAPFLTKLYSQLPSWISLLLFVTMVLVFICVSIFVILKEKLCNPLYLIMAFVIVYSIGFMYISITTGQAQMDIRQLNYPFFFVMIGFLILAFSNMGRVWIKKCVSVLVLLLITFGSIKTYGRLKAFRTVGYGEMAGTKYLAHEYDCLKYAYEFIENQKTEIDHIYTNKHKVLGINFGFVELGKLPTSKIWEGNHTYFLEGDTKTQALKILYEKILLNQGIVIYVGDDFLNQVEFYKQNIIEGLEIKVFEDGFVVHKNVSYEP